MLIHVRDVSLFVRNLWTRMPFRYGIATLTAVPHVVVRVELVVDGDVSIGHAADHLPPKWFTKDPQRSTDDEVVELIGVVKQAAAHARATQAMPSVFDLWRQIYAAQRRWGESLQLPPLLWNFGVTLMERAIIDAFCRGQRLRFSGAVRSNALSIRLWEIHPELEDAQPADLLPAEPLRTLTVRHTVGLTDPITAADIPDAERLDDGLPQSLDQCIGAHGLTHFKIKIPFDPGDAVDRLSRLAELITTRCPTFSFTLDGNEFYHDIAGFRELWERLIVTPCIAEFLRRGLIFVEQPLHRDVALSDDTAAHLRRWRDRPTMIIDESDATLGAVRQALDAGYHGTSHKNCKGVIKGIAAACLIEHRRHTTGHPLVMSCEDLSNVGPIALLQDLAVVATLGIPHAERNGHHYFAGLSGWPGEVQQAMLAAHGDLYHSHTTPQGDTWPALHITRGAIDVTSIVDAPFGCAISAGNIDASQLTPIDDWHVSSLQPHAPDPAINITPPPAPQR